MGIRRNKTILEQAADYVEAAVDKAGPVLADVKERAGTALADAREQAAPVLAQAADVAADKAAQGKELATAKAAELAGRPKKKKHRLRTLLLLTGIAAAVGFVAKKLTSRDDNDSWQSPPPPRPAPAPRASDTPLGDAAAASTESTESADGGGAGPDEALADATDESHEATTPDEPAEVVDVSPGEEPVVKKSAKP